VVLFALLMSQGALPLNPQHLPGLSWDLALNTAVSFVSNTNWQAYAGESTMSYLSQMAGLTVQNFLSAATGIAVIFAFTRAWPGSRSAPWATPGSISPALPYGCCCRFHC
jgi:K+-transporting ATPase ATPase A chain